jgi:hypothetical protein
MTTSRHRKLNILIICKLDEPRKLHIDGVEGQLNVLKMIDSIPWRTPKLQTGLLASTDPLPLNGYTVALLQTPMRR